MRMDEGKEVLNQEKKAKLSENKKDLKLELLCPTFGDKYLASRKRQPGNGKCISQRSKK